MALPYDPVMMAYKPKYFIGDRVFGFLKKVPFIGSVGNDSIINHTDGPKISIHLDLPLRVDGVVRNVIFVKHKDIKSKLIKF
jgi:hypothetical protein